MPLEAIAIARAVSALIRTAMPLLPVSGSTYLPSRIHQLLCYVFSVDAFGGQLRTIADQSHECRLPTPVDGRRTAEIDHNPATPVCPPSLIPSRFEF